MSRKEKIRLILRQLNNKADSNEKEDFSQWLLKKPENLDLYIEVKDLWELSMTKEMKFSSTSAEKRIAEVVKKNKKRLLSLQYIKRITAAVIILLSIGTGAYFQFTKSHPKVIGTWMIKQITKTSGAGEQLRVTLPDGSIVRLNAGSSIQFPEKFIDNFRPVKLAGEAFFEVAKDPDHPFTITSGYVVTTVWGTSFNIKAFDKADVAITVATGKVKVECHSGEKSDGLFLYHNQQAIYKLNENQLLMNDVNAINYYSWTNDILRFNDDSFDEVVKMLERWYNVTIRLEGNFKKGIRVSGSYRDKKLYTILDGLSFMYDLSYQYQNDTTIIIYSN